MLVGDGRGARLDAAELHLRRDHRLDLVAPEAVGAVRPLLQLGIRIAPPETQVGVRGGSLDQTPQMKGSGKPLPPALTVRRLVPVPIGGALCRVTRAPMFWALQSMPLIFRVP